MKGLWKSIVCQISVDFGVEARRMASVSMGGVPARIQTKAGVGNEIYQSSAEASVFRMSTNQPAP